MDELSDEDIQQLIALGIIPDQQNDIQQQIALAEKLRYGGMPQMQGNARVQTAASPLEFLATVLQGRQANKQIEDLRKQQNQLLQDQVAARTKFYQALRRRGTPASPAPQTDFDPTTNPEGYE